MFIDIGRIIQVDVFFKTPSCDIAFTARNGKFYGKILIRV